jgi:hypothetical protein
MSGRATSSDATPSALGYLYQCRYALLLALQRDDDSDLRVAIEKLDDVAFLRDSDDGATPVELLQLKHHISRKGGLTDKSSDIWKTVRIWAEAVKDKRLDLDHAILLMVTTSEATDRHAIRFLRPEGKGRNTDEAQKKLEEAGRSSTSQHVTDGYSALMRLSAAARKRLFRAVYLLEGSPNIIEVRRLLEKAVRHAVLPQHRTAFVDRLEGWWFRIVVEHLIAPTDRFISVSEVQQHIHDLREQFRRESLPDDFLRADVPETKRPDEDARVFIKQLRLVRLTVPRIRTAQEDHYKAFAQRSQWVRDNLVDMDEIGTFEVRLTDEWKHKFEMMAEGLANPCDDGECAGSGLALYNWTQDGAPANVALFIRPGFSAGYLIRGSYHMLADVLRVGWHPHYRRHLMNGEAEEGRNAEDVA